MAKGGCTRMRAGDFLRRHHSQSLLPKSKNLKREKKEKGLLRHLRAKRNCLLRVGTLRGDLLTARCSFQEH